MLAAPAWALVLVLTACGTSKAVPEPAAAATQASAASQEATEVRVGDVVDLAEALAPTAAAMKEKMSFDFAGTVPQSGTMSGEMSLGGSSPSMSLDTEVEGESVTMMLIDGVMYMGGFADMPAGKKYLKIDPESDDPMSQIMAPLLSQMAEAVDPSAMTAGVTGLKGKVVEVKDGVVTYESTLTAEQQREMTAKQLVKMGLDDVPTQTAAPTDMTIRQTIGTDDLPVTIEITGAGTSEGLISIAYSGWGEPNTVTAPPAAEVTTFADMM